MIQNRKSPVKGLIKSAFHRLGFEVTRLKTARNSVLNCIDDLTDAEKQIVDSVLPFTMTGMARIASLVEAVRYLTRNGISGDIAECGVWRGGSMMAAARVLLAHNDTTRSLYLYDTFEGMVPPGDHDKRFDGQTAEALREYPWCLASLEDVRRNVLSTGYPSDKIHFVEGRVEKTIPGILPAHLALLRLDTDWYESTRHELTHLFPLLDQKGIMIIDDYGHWRGARKAVDEYFQERNECVYLHRIDYSGRLLIRNPVSRTEKTRITA